MLPQRFDDGSGMFRPSKEFDDDDDDGQDCIDVLPKSSGPQFTSISGLVMKRPIELILVTLRYGRENGENRLTTGCEHLLVLTPAAM